MSIFLGQLCQTIVEVPRETEVKFNFPIIYLINYWYFVMLHTIWLISVELLTFAILISPLNSINLLILHINWLPCCIPNFIRRTPSNFSNVAAVRTLFSFNMNAPPIGSLLR